MGLETETKQIDGLIARFYAAFDNRKGRAVDINSLQSMFVPQAQIFKCVDGEFECYTFEQFAEPRQKLLSSNQYLNFHEYELSARTDCLGNIAQRWSLYEKKWIENGIARQGRGVKSFHLAKNPTKQSADGQSDVWKITSTIWDDEREGVVIPDQV